MGRLVQRIEPETAPRVVDGPVVGAGAGVGVHEAVEQLGEFALEPFRLRELPILEARSVADGEPLEEFPAVQVGGALVALQAPPTRLRRGVFVLGWWDAEAVELLDVDPGLVRLERDRLALESEPAVAEPVVQDGERPAQRAARPCLVAGRPEQSREMLAGPGPGDGNVREDRGRLARVDRQGLAVHLDERWAQQGHLQSTQRSLLRTHRDGSGAAGRVVTAGSVRRTGPDVCRFRNASGTVGRDAGTRGTSYGHYGHQ